MWISCESHYNQMICESLGWFFFNIHGTQRLHRHLLDQRPCEQSRWEMGQDVIKNKGMVEKTPFPGTLNNQFFNGCLMKQPFFYVKIWNHPTERTPIKHCCLEFQVYHITNQVFFNYLGPNQSDRILVKLALWGLLWWCNHWLPHQDVESKLLPQLPQLVIGMNGTFGR